MKDDKGDTLEYPKVIQSLPFWDTANTYFFDGQLQPELQWAVQ